VIIPSDLVGRSAGPLVQDVDARWLMAYAAALGDAAPEYLDTARAGGIVGHPLFPVCYEWPLAVEFRTKAMSEAIAARSVHATHDLRLARRPRPGDRLRTTATVVSTEPRSPGAYVVTRFETVDANGQLVSSTDYGSIYRGVDCERAAIPAPPAAAVQSGSDDSAGDAAGRAGEAAPTAPDWSATVPVPAGLAHTYTECARIWNPIHTDRAVARSAGLEEIILHGTATLALAVSAALDRANLGPAAPVTRVTCRFTGMVPLPSALTVRGWGEPHRDGPLIRFDALTPDGRAALRGRLAVATERAGHRR